MQHVINSVAGSEKVLSDVICVILAFKQSEKHEMNAIRCRSG